MPLDRYLQGLKDSDRAILDEIYEPNFKLIRAFVKRYKGSEDDAKDVFQEALAFLYDKLQTTDIEIKTTFKTYLFSIGKNIWLGILKKRGYKVTMELENVPDVDEMKALIQKEQRRTLFRKKLKKLGDECKRILDMYFGKFKYKEIAETLGITEVNARQKKVRCQKTLTRLIQSDSSYPDLYK